MQEIMEMEEDIVIVGGGIAGLTTALGLHRLGLRSLVLESSESLRTTGFALSLWTNAWRALDAVGIGNSLRERYPQIPRIEVGSSVSRATSEIESPEKNGRGNEGRCIRRKELLETLERELPHGTLRYSSKVVSIEDTGYRKLLHLADGSTLKTKVLIGCDGVNSLVAKWLGLPKPVHSGRSAIRGFAEYPDSHGFHPRVQAYFQGGVRYGYVPCGANCFYWYQPPLPADQVKALPEFDYDGEGSPTGRGRGRGGRGRGRGRSRVPYGNGYPAAEYDDGGWDGNRGYARGQGRGRGRNFRGRGRGGYNGPHVDFQQDEGGYNQEPPARGYNDEAPA